MRKIKYIIIHCSAVGPRQASSAVQIDAWHKARGYKCIGYHYVIRRNGSVEQGRPEAAIGAHCNGYNAESIGVCYEGGVNLMGKPADTRTEAQKSSMLELLRELKSKYPEALIRGHNDFSNKACPCFNAKEEYEKI